MKKMEQAIQVSTKQKYLLQGKLVPEVFQDGESRVNSTYIGYAPINNPKLSFSIVYTNQPVPPPWLNGGDLGRDVINYYFDDKSNQFTFN